MIDNISICKVRIRGLFLLRVLMFSVGIRLLIRDVHYLVEWEILEIIGVPLCIVILID
jgi:hypothetical protein